MLKNRRIVLAFSFVALILLVGSIAPLDAPATGGDILPTSELPACHGPPKAPNCHLAYDRVNNYCVEICHTPSSRCGPGGACE